MYVDRTTVVRGVYTPQYTRALSIAPSYTQCTTSQQLLHTDHFSHRFMRPHFRPTMVRTLPLRTLGPRVKSHLGPTAENHVPVPGFENDRRDFFPYPSVLRYKNPIRQNAIYRLLLLSDCLGNRTDATVASGDGRDAGNDGFALVIATAACQIAMLSLYRRGLL